MSRDRKPVSRIFASPSELFNWNAPTLGVDALGFDYISLVNNSGTWELVRKAGALSDTMRQQAETKISQHLCQLRSAIQATLNGQSVVTDDLRLLPTDIETKIATLSTTGSSTVISGELAAKISPVLLTAYSAIKWFNHGHISKLKAFETAVISFANNNNSFSKCTSVCDAFAEFVNSIPSPAAWLQSCAAGITLYNCYGKCCGLGGV